MNLMQLLEFLNADWAEKERQRRLRKMMSPDDQYMDGKTNAQGGVVVPSPYIRNYDKIAPAPEPYGLIDRIPIDNFNPARPLRRPIRGPRTVNDLEV